MGCGLPCVVPADHAEAATTVLAGHHPGARRIGRVTDQAARVVRAGVK